MIEFKKSVLFTFITRIILFGVGIIISILLARLLGPMDRGRYALLVLFPTVLFKLGSMGLEVANIYYTANKMYSRKEIIGNSIVISIILSAILILLFWISTNFHIFREYLKNNNITINMLWLAISLLPALMMNQFLIQVILGSGNIIAFNISQILQTIIHLVLIVIFLVLTKYSLAGSIYALIGSNIFSLVLIFLIIKRFEKIGFSLNINLLKKSILYGAKAYFGNIAQFLNYRLDMFIVAAFLNVKELGLYAVAVGIAEKLWLIPSSLSAILFPKVSSMEKKDATFVTVKSTKHTFYIVLISGMILALVSKFMIQILYGSNYLKSVEPFIILLPGILLLSITKVLTSDLAGRGKPEFGAISSFVSLVINVTLNILLIPRWGINGAAFSTTVCYSAATILVVVSFSRLTNTPIKEFFRLKKEDISVYKKILCNPFFYKKNR